MRLFIGIEFQEAVLARLHSLQDDLRNLVHRGRFSARDNMHLTLYFLGETPESETKQIIGALEKIAKTTPAFVLSFNNQPGYFGGTNPARVVWLGFNGNLAALQNLQSKVAFGMHQLGFSDENRNYQPHVTLAREVEFNNTGLLQKNGKVEFDAGAFPLIHVDHFSLISSSQESGKRIYRPLAKFELSDFCRK